MSPDTRGYMLVGNATDGELYEFSVDRSNWGTYIDKVGTVEIPFPQVVTIKTGKKRITMDFESEPENYNRLLFPHQDFLFSDFEGLGVTCTVKIEEYQYRWWDLFKLRPIYTTIYEFVTDDAGLEYGYDTRATNFPNIFN